MKLIKKIFVILSFLLMSFFSVYAEDSFINDNQYFYYWWQTCGHCAVVEQYRETTDVDEKMNIEKYEVQQNSDNSVDMLHRWNDFWIMNELWTPFLVVVQSDWTRWYVMWSDDIIQYTKDIWSGLTWNIEYWYSDVILDTDNHRKFFAIMLPAALSDSINPCAFAVMLLLLTAILSKTKNKKSALLSWLAFSLAVFITYFLLWLWIFKLLWWVESLSILKWIVWILWLVVWLANIKDFFRYGKWFVMEVPMAWRPAMQKIVKKVTSPLWAFVIGIIISLFLLPCSSWPYLTILWFLSAENQWLNMWGYIYLIVYNLIFVLPMIAIAVIVWCWFATAEKIWAFKNKNTRLIHLIVWLLMLWLWLYVIGSMYRW